MLAGQVAGEGDAPPEQRVFLLEKSQYVVHDTWFAGGLRGTGSKDVEAADAFVPEHRTLAVADLRGGATPGSVVNPGPLYRMPVFALFPYMLSGVALGVAEGLIDQFASGTVGRGKMTGAKIAAVQSVQLRLGEAAAFARASRLFQETNCREAQAMIERGDVPDLPTKTRYRLEGAYAVDWAVRAVDTMFMLSGASGLYESGHVARAMRDAHAVKQHFSFNTDVAGTTYGRVALGLPCDNPTL
jgi:3-hydroxy-9,10-secoandrosta-1,3,5(10)-triene-9,17-dione monooxygenase